MVSYGELWLGRYTSKNVITTGTGGDTGLGQNSEMTTVKVLRGKRRAWAADGSWYKLLVPDWRKSCSSWQLDLATVTTHIPPPDT